MTRKQKPPFCASCLVTRLRLARQSICGTRRWDAGPTSLSSGMRSRVWIRLERTQAPSRSVINPSGLSRRSFSWCVSKNPDQLRPEESHQPRRSTKLRQGPLSGLRSGAFSGPRSPSGPGRRRTPHPSCHRRGSSCDDKSHFSHLCALLIGNAIGTT